MTDTISTDQGLPIDTPDPDEELPTDFDGGDNEDELDVVLPDEDIGDASELEEGEPLPDEDDEVDLTGHPVGLRAARKLAKLAEQGARGVTPLSRSQATTILRNLGWRVRTTTEYTRCIRNFQAGWNLGTALAVDGNKGPKTDAALRLSEARRRAGKTTASAHFSFTEVRCRCGGKYSSCQRIWIKRSALRMMEKYRSSSGRALTVVSGCRCPSMNKAVGGSPTSRHLTGLACDVPARYSVSRVKSWRCATHIGYGSVSRLVKHIDYGSGRTVYNPAVYPDGR